MILTGTAPELTPPFGAGKLAPESAYYSPTGMLLTSLKQTSGPSLVRRIDTGTKAASTVTTALRAGMVAGDWLAGTPTILVPGFGGDIFVNSKSLKAVLTGPVGVFLSAEVGSRSGAFGVFIASDHTGITVPVVRIVNGPIMVLPPEKSLRQIVLTRSGGGLLNGLSLRYLSPGKNVLVSSGAKVRLVISGAGG